MDLLSTLNAEQRAAVTAPIGPILVRAGAGSGKTRVLTLRVAHLIDEIGAAPNSILALTFTNKAAREMRERLKTLLGNRARGLTIGTFHGICARVLRAEIEGRIRPYTAAFTIYDSGEQLQLAAAALDGATERPPTSLEADEVLRRISRCKSQLLSPQLAARFAHDPIDRFIAGCYRRYQQALRRSNALDFDDLILLTHQLFQEHPDILESYQARWQHTLSDEFQDTDASQYGLLELISRPRHNHLPRSLFAVGDGMQSIYAFRNADYTIINRFAQDFPEARIIELTTNYRSQQAILDAAYAVIRHSRSVPPMALRAASTVRGANCVLFLEARDARDEAEQVASQISILHQQGRCLREIAVLFRTHAMSRSLETALRHAHIPYTVRGGTSFYDRAVVRDALAYLRTINNPADNLSLTRIANQPARGLPAQALSRLSAFAAQQGLSLSDALSHRDGLAQLSRKAAQGAQTLAALLSRWRHFASQAVPPDHLLSDVLEQSRYLAALAERLPPEEYTDARLHLQELTAAAQEHTALSEFLQEVALMTQADERDDGRDQVQLLTIHAAKGLEWPIVFVVGLEEGTLPHERSLNTHAELEEERRLCYVALTRAAERLHLSWVAGRIRGQQLKPSRFLEEIKAYGRELMYSR